MYELLLKRMDFGINIREGENEMRDTTIAAQQITRCLQFAPSVLIQIQPSMFQILWTGCEDLI
jgi:hypothetical protein